jgi:hypothetical protein
VKAHTTPVASSSPAAINAASDRLRRIVRVLSPSGAAEAAPGCPGRIVVCAAAGQRMAEVPSSVDGAPAGETGTATGETGRPAGETGRGTPATSASTTATSALVGRSSGDLARHRPHSPATSSGRPSTAGNGPGSSYRWARSICVVVVTRHGRCPVSVR